MSVRLDNLQAQRVAAGHSISRLAHLATVSDWTITQLENIGTGGAGGTCTHDIADRICEALGISRATAGFVDLG
jgi:predicted transcriptional regulator